MSVDFSKDLEKLNKLLQATQALPENSRKLKRINLLTQVIQHIKEGGHYSHDSGYIMTPVGRVMAI